MYRLEPSRREYANRLRSRIYEVMRDKIWHMSLETLKEKNPWLYEKLRSQFPAEYPNGSVTELQTSANNSTYLLVK